MTSREQIQQEIEKTLDSLNSVKRAQANSFLFTRLKARMNKKADRWEGLFSFISKPAIAVAILILVMLSPVAILIYLARRGENNLTPK